MSDEPLLLPSAKMGVPIAKRPLREYAQWVCFAVGVAVLLYGFVSILGRMSAWLPAAAVSDTAARTAFEPLGMFVPTQHLSTSPAATTSPIIPARIKIPSIGVDAAVEQVGKNADGSMATPRSFADVGWYKLGSKPGQAGNAVVAGHVNNALTKAGVFEHLSSLAVGDTIVVSDAAGRSLRYTVTQMDQYKTTEAPASTIFSGSGPSQLVLITCDGAWDDAAHSYDKRFVAYARLAQ